MAAIVFEHQPGSLSDALIGADAFRQIFGKPGVAPAGGSSISCCRWGG